MEFKDRKNHYLHPDFEDIEINSEKKLSPLALLAQACKNVGSVKDTRDVFFYNRNQSPNSSNNGLKKFSKRCSSDSSSNSSSTDRDYLSPIKKPRLESKIPKKRKSENIVQKIADTSSEASLSSGTSLISNLIHFVKNSNNSHLVDADKIELINFLASQKNSKPKHNDFSKSANCTKKSNQFNVEKGYHLETIEESANRGSAGTNHDYSPQIIPENLCPIESYLSTLDNSKTSAIKYCMYCGKLIPILPMLLAHIRLEHGTTNYPDSNVQSSFNSSPIPNMYDVFSKFNPYLTSNEIKASQTFSFLTDYMNSSFKGLNNLIC